MNIQAIIELVDAGVTDVEIATFHSISLSDLGLIRRRLCAPASPAQAPPALTLRQQLLVAVAHQRSSYASDRELLYAVDALVRLERETAP